MHRVTGVAEAIEEAGATLIYLPEYSPDLNPIEMAFSKLKAHLRKAAEHTISRLLRRIGRAVTDFTAQECSNYFHMQDTFNMTGIALIGQLPGMFLCGFDLRVRQLRSS